MKPVANYDRGGHLIRLHLFPTEECNTEAKDMKNREVLDTREKLLKAILSVSRLEHLCEHEVDA